MCQWLSAAQYITFEVYKGTTLLSSQAYYEDWYMPIMVAEADYAAGDVFNVKVLYDWLGNVPRDYTVKVYSKQSLSITDEDGNTN